MNKDVVVVGGNSQLGQSLKAMRPKWQYVHKHQLNFLESSNIQKFFKQKPKVIINCAAFTAVDLAESKKDEALQINSNAVGELAKSCETLIHFSTDYVFDGLGQHPYTEEDQTEPANYYGYSKRAGEIHALKNNERSYIFRTSWVYSKFGVNFVKRMLELAQTRNELKIVNDQMGSPTYASDLAKVVLALAENPLSLEPGIYNYSNEGYCSWFEFAAEIFKIKKTPIQLIPIPSSEYPTPAHRPKYSVLNKNKIKEALNMQIPEWRESLNQFFLNDYPK